MRKMRLFSTFLAALSITTFVMGSTSNAATTNSLNDTKFNLESSKLNQYDSFPEVKNIIDNLSENATSGNVVEAYLKVGRDADGNQFEKPYTESEYLREQIMPRNVPIEQNFGWIKLRLEAYQTSGTNNILVAGFYEWLRQPYFSGQDTFALGHDASITFNNQSCFGTFISPYYDSVINKNAQKIQRVDRSNGDRFLSSASGVAYKFRLGDSHGINDPNDEFPSLMYDNGMMYVEGTVLNGSGNLQISYGHSEIALDYTITDAVEFLTTGAIKFNVKGTQDLKTIGDRVVLE